MRKLDQERLRKQALDIVPALKKRQFDANFFETRIDAKRHILDQIKPEETVGIGGSLTWRDSLTIVPDLRKQGNMVYDHWEAQGDPVRRLELKRAHRGVDVFLTSVNAITRDGIMVNLDGGGNRVASTCSGPRRVLVALGTNKIADTLDHAVHRTRQNAAVLNAMRLARKTPCTETGVCMDCNTVERICAALLILYKKPSDINRFSVVLINEEMGY
jgi:hypothetical protein